MSYIMHFNKNHDKLGRFTFGDGNGDGVIGKADPNSYRTPELDKKYSELEKTGLIKNLQNSDLKWLGADSTEKDADTKWGKDVADAVRLGVEAMRSLPEFDFIDPGDFEEKDILSQFLLGDWSEQNAYPEVAYLASKGFNKDQIVKAFHDADEMYSKNNEFFKAYTGYPDNDNYTKYSDKAYDMEPYKGIYSMADRAYEINNDNPGFLGEFANKCVELAKEVKHSDMSSDYLEHFNPRHDPKTGRFDFAPGSSNLTSSTSAFPKERYGGESRSNYVKSMRDRYQSEGFSKGKARSMAKEAAKANKLYTDQFNVNLRGYNNKAQKAIKAYEKGDANKYTKEYKKLLESYRWMSINDKMLAQSYELGKANFEPVWKKLVDAYTFGGAIPGTAKAFADFRDTGKNKWTGADKMGKIFKDARAETTKQMKMDYVTLHPDEAVEQYMLVSKLEDVLYGKE